MKELQEVKIKQEILRLLKNWFSVEEGSEVAFYQDLIELTDDIWTVTQKTQR